MSSAYKCNWCDRAYPRVEDYRVCPVCRENTIPTGHVPMLHADAEDLRREMDFGWWLWDTGRL